MTDTDLRDPAWRARLLERNRRGARTALVISAALFPIFGGVDWLLAPREALPLLWGTRAALMPYILWMLWSLDRPVFERHFVLLSAIHIYLAGASICVMTTVLGGLASPYYAGVNLVLLGAGLLYLWPLRAVLLTYGAVIASWALPALALERVEPLQTAASNTLFLVSTAIIVGAGQVLAYRADVQQHRTLVQLAATNAELATANDRIADAHRNVEHAHAELKKLDEFKSQLFANITHELRTPLAMILAPIEMMMQGDLGPMNETAQKTLSSMMRSGTKLLKLINDLLDLTKLEESRLQLYVQELDLVAWLQVLVGQVRPLAQRKEIELELVALCPQASVVVDPEHIERVFVNLLSNAVKFTPQHGRITVEVDADDAEVRVRVRDTGAGFAPDVAERIFERFFQVDMGGTRKFGGTGIGLALARELVELHGGTIRAEGEQGQGAIFHVALRRGSAHLADDVKSRVSAGAEADLSTVLMATAAMPRSESYRLLDIAEATERRVLERDADEHQRSHTVLIVEDTPDVTRIIHLALRRDFKVMAAPDGLKGLELALRHRPDLIITDLMMPGIDGLELARRLRTDPSTADTPIIMLTARGAVEDRVAGVESGVSVYMPKPFSARELVSTVHNLLGIRARQAERLLAGRMDSLEAIAGGMAHEINNPLNYLQQGLAVIERELEVLAPAAADAGSDPARQRSRARVERMFQSARAGLERISKVVELMKRYSREGYARVAQPLPLRAAIEDVAHVVRRAVDAAAEVEIEVIGEPAVVAVPEELHQVLTNLIQNALEAVATVPQGRVLVRCWREGDEVLLLVIDNGIGMDEETCQRVFTPFYSTKGPGRGMGMGTTITWRVVNALGGKISIDSELGQGTTFRVTLPAAPEMGHDVPAHERLLG